MASTFLRFGGVQHFRSVCPEKENISELGWEGGEGKNKTNSVLRLCL